jgi:predicted phage terminase large subunit-like protein
MERPQSSKSDRRTCDVCQKERGPKDFYKDVATCRPCLQKHLKIELTAAVGATDVERHRQEKERRALIRSELKRLARQRIQNRKAKRKARARAALIPKAPEVTEVVDPAVKELAQRELARRRLIEFIQEFHPRYKAGWVHHDICRRLEQFAQDVAAGKSPRLMILMPPRHGKSQIASKLFPAWTLGHYNYFELIACSYNVSLALEFSREVRDVVRSDRYSVLFPSTEINPEAQAAEAWRLLSATGVGSGGYVAAGIGGPITGKGAHILIIDDPVKNAEEAESAEMRQKIWDWYRSTAYTRLAPGGGVLVIQTCWHDDDLAGRLQEEMKQDPEADQFEIVKYPAIAIEDEEYRMAGEALHPERYDSGALAKIKRTIGLRYWAALYQQDPVPDEGAYFTKEMFVRRPAPADRNSLHIYQAWDFAISEKKQNDWNVGVTVGLDYNDVMHVLEVVRFKTKDAGRIIDEMLDMHERWSSPGVQQVGVEDGQIWRAMNALLKKRMTERRVYPNFGDPQKPLTDKMVRARPLQGRMQHGKVTFPRAAPWLEALEKEMLRFPAGVHDDQVDALAWAATLVIGKAPPKAPVYRNRTDHSTLAEQLRKLGRVFGSGPMAA